MDSIQKKILGASLGECVHVAGILNFLNLARTLGFQTHFLGPAVPVSRIVKAVQEEKADIVAISYRLSPGAALEHFRGLKEEISCLELTQIKFILGGTEPVCKVGRKLDFFDAVFSSAVSLDDLVAYLRGGTAAAETGDHIKDEKLLDRICRLAPQPLIRHHYGEPSYKKTLRGVEHLAREGILDIISLGPDQNTQQFFFKPEKMDAALNGAGGVPLRSREDFVKLKKAANTGNYPLMRCYAGTENLLQMANLLQETIDNAWCAVPLTWYSVLDGRGNVSLRERLQESREVMRWHAERNIPVEVNEAHQWSLREAPDTVAAAAFYLAAYQARLMGVKDYVAQFMFNTPEKTSPVMDLGKMLAKADLLAALEDDSFKVIRQTRAGLSSFPPNFDLAKGHLACSTFLQMALRPAIVHVVAYCEAHHAAAAEDIIESCRIARGVIDDLQHDMIDLAADERVQKRRRELKEEALMLLEAIKSLGSGIKDPLGDPETIARAVETGLLDAPHLSGSPYARGKVRTTLADGACRAVDSSGKPLPEKERLAEILKNN